MIAPLAPPQYTQDDQCHGEVYRPCRRQPLTNASIIV